MHHCLCVDEILREIFRCIERRSTLCVLARTCRTFYNPATDQIWETLTAMEPILRHLSPARLVKDPESGSYYLALLHPPSEDDWNTIRRLSSRVRKLHILLGRRVPLRDAVNDAAPQWFHHLASPPDSSFLFSNLRALSFEVDSYIDRSSTGDAHARISQAVIRLFHLLLGPQLSALRFELPSSLYFHLDIPSIPVLCPNIRTLSFGKPDLYCNGAPVPDEITYRFSRAVPQLRRLETVRSYMTSWGLLSSLAEAKALRKLWMFLPHKLSPVPRRPCGNIFPQLRTLDISTRSLTLCLEFLRWASFKELTGIYIDCPLPTGDRDFLQILVDMSSLISSQYKNLEFLWIFIRPFDDREIVTAWPRPMLEQYRAFHQLRVIALQTGYSLTLADNDFEDMVEAWPHLEMLHLFHDDITSPPVHLTLRGVTALLYHCPKLKHFTLMFDATRVPGPEGFVPFFRGTLVQNTSVRYMGVYISPASESVEVATYLSILMPYLMAVGVKSAAFWSEWSWICTRHQRKPAIEYYVDAERVYPVPGYETEYDNDGHAGDGQDWSWTCYPWDR
ncbi:hypothetical protein EDD17DRAFT_473673 [Pisolithus thermaeus]|nr:hypothetical protein EDD17DRAFT_473673 [Pisolithus thermaeus]